jgi:hypothetical protein
MSSVEKIIKVIIEEYKLLSLGGGDRRGIV